MSNKSETIKALGCTFCGYIWKPKFPGKKPVSCPRCHRYFNEKRPVVWVRVPKSYFEKPDLPVIKSFALPDIAKVTCQKCGEKTTRGGIVDGQFLCVNCVVEYILKRAPKQIGWRELLVEEEKKTSKS